jgi:sulfate/thiosulfate transport system permease protein
VSLQASERLPLARVSTTVTRPSLGPALSGGLVVLYLSVLVLIPLGAVVVHATDNGWSGFWAQVHSPFAWSALKLTVGMSVLVALINLVMGTAIAWVLVRDRLPGR